jgi:hypothetical protein
MKSIKHKFLSFSKICLVILAVSFCGLLKAQPLLIENFTGTQFNNSIVINFTLVKGNTCFDTEIQRSTDGVNFNVIYTISGICGSTLENVSYSITDNSPVGNSYNYYRINLRSLGFSDIIKVRYIDFSASNALVIYNYQQQLSTLFYKNPSAKKIEFEILNQHGMVIQKGASNKSEWVVSTSDWPHGLYFVRFMNGDVAITRNLIVF